MVFSEALEVICELDMALDAILEVAVAGVATNVVSDVAVEQQGSGHERGGWGLGRDSVGRLGMGCCRF